MTENQSPDIVMDQANLYQEEIFTDNKVGTIRRMTPVTVDGQVDSTRSVSFVGQAQMMTPAGALPLSFEIDAANLDEAVAKYGDAASQALEDTMKELQEMRRQQASQIVVPGADPMSSKIQMP